MSSIIDEVRSAIPSNSRKSATGWNNFCCPACGDKRYRGGIKFTESGGFRYLCFNGGCDFNINPTGWEPDNGFGGRPRHIFELMGGNLRNIPLDQLMKWNNKTYDKEGKEVGTKKELTVVYQFPEVELPEGATFLIEAYKKDKRAEKVLRALVRRIRSYVEDYTFLWTPKHPYHYILPYFHYKDKIVGYLGRDIRKGVNNRFIQRSPRDYLFRQHVLNTYRPRYLLVIESPIDALLLNGIGTRSNVLTEKQVNLLKTSGKDIIVVPDRKRKGDWEGYLAVAKEQNWFVSVPDWGAARDCGDPGDSVSKNGLLYTAETIVKSASRNYKKVEQELILRQKI